MRPHPHPTWLSERSMRYALIQPSGRPRRVMHRESVGRGLILGVELDEAERARYEAVKAKHREFWEESPCWF